MEKMKYYVLMVFLSFGILGCHNNRVKKSDTDDNDEKIDTILNSIENKKNEPIKKQEVQYMLFTHSSEANLNNGNILKPNAALLIEDKSKIENAQEFFLSERKSRHLCGYDYDVLFWFDTDNKYLTARMNKKCEVFTNKPKESQKLLNHYAKLLETKPSHYIYDIEISVTYTPEAVKKELRDNGLTVFSFESYSEQFPTLWFSYRNSRYVGQIKSSNIKWRIAEQENYAESRKLIKEIVDKVKTVSKVTNTIIQYNSYGRTGDDMTHKGSVGLIFEDEENLILAVKILRQTKAEIESIKIPETYTLQLIDTSDNIEIIKKKLRPYEFVKKVSKYFPYDGIDISEIMNIEQSYLEEYLEKCN